METARRFLATTHEVSLKGGNRLWFERRLGNNVRHALAGLPIERTDRPAWRVLITFREPVEVAEVVRRLSTVFGLNSIMAVHHMGMTLPELFDRLPPYLEGLAPSSFAVRCIRSDKRFPTTSTEVEREVGGVIQERTGWRVDLEQPELTVRLLIDNAGLWLWLHRYPGPGGLPVGTGGRAACLLSGGIDSPVSAYLMMKRGMRVDFVHCHSVPQTDPASLEKVRDLVRQLNRHQLRGKLVLVPLLPIQDAVVAGCPPELRILLYRRFMLRLASRVAHRLGAAALITGESLGQVASQTIENLAALEPAAGRPVLRPLIGLDKLEIIALARHAGTYDISIRPHFDCCSYLLPARPATRTTAAELAAAEAALPIDELVREALAASTAERIEAAPWSDAVAPPAPEPVLA